MHQARRFSCFCAWLALLSAVACAVSPKPEPPAGGPGGGGSAGTGGIGGSAGVDVGGNAGVAGDGIAGSAGVGGSAGGVPPKWDPERVDLQDCGPTCDEAAVILAGQQAAVKEPGAIVWAVNLDSTNAPVQTPVGPDGSFKLRISASPTNQIRFQVRAGSRRADPVDVVAAIGSLQRVSHTLGNCLALHPAYDLAFATTADPPADLVVTNQCAQAISVERVALRSTGSVFVLDPATLPATLNQGQSLALSVGLATPPEGAFEEILFVETVSPSKDRFAITVLVEPGGS